MPTNAFQARPSGNLLTHRNSILLVLLPFGRLYSLLCGERNVSRRSGVLLQVLDCHIELGPLYDVDPL